MYLFIVNPVSGKGKGKKIWAKVEKKLLRDGVPFAFTFTGGPGEAAAIVRKRLGEFLPGQIKGIVAVGGDGTAHEVINGIMQSGETVPFGYIPAGSGNDLARGLGLGNWETALAAVLGGRMRPIDVGVINGTHFFVTTVSAGLDGEVAHLSNTASYKGCFNRLKLGSLTYVMAMLQMLMTFRRSRLYLRIDAGERSWEKVWLVAVGNLPCYGGGMYICPGARPDDGKFHVCVVHGISRLKLLWLFPKVYKGGHLNHPAVEMLESAALRIEYEKNCHFQMDGEVKGKTPVEIRLLPKRLLVLLP